MKFTWFHLMNYPKLPDDFRERYNSVWVDLPAAEVFDPRVGNQMYNEFLDELEYADEMGFDGIGVNEHHSNAYGISPSPNILAGTLARRTRNAKLVVMGNSVALYNPPVRVAEEMALLDVISGGRLVAGFPIGTPMDTLFCYGQNPATLRQKYHEAVDLILRSWQAPKPFAFNGKFTQLRYVNPWPRPLQQPHPPVWIPGSGSVETWDYCAERDYLYAYLSFFGYQMAKRNLDGFWDAVERHGRDHNPYRAGFVQFICVADSDAEAERLYSKAALYFYNRCLHIGKGFLNPAGYRTPETIRKNLPSQMKAMGSAMDANLTWADLVDRGYVIAGSPDTVVDQVKELATQLNVGHLLVMLQFGPLDKETTTYNTHRFATECMPRLAGHFGEWEDRWWPKDVLEDPAVPAPIREWSEV